MAFDLNLFLNDLTKDVSIDEANKQALNTILSNPTVAKRLEESTLRQGDYSSKVTEYQKKIQAAQDYWNGLVEWDKKAKLELEAEKARIRSAGGIDTQDHTVDGLKREDLQKLAQEALAYNNAITKISMQYLKDFGEVLDPNELLKISQENGGININLAYDKFIQPKRDELQRKQTEEALAKARQEGAEEALKNLNLPTNNNPMQVANTQLDNLMKKPDDLSGKYGALAAVKAWQEGRAKGSIPNTAF